VAPVDYRYELWRADEVIATGHLKHERPLAIGDWVEIGGYRGIVRTIDPLLHEYEMRLVVQVLIDSG
jgi:mechanosensitive ion channel-like protein